LKLDKKEKKNLRKEKKPKEEEARAAGRV